jgi:CRP-like cAMP-binding protein
MRTPYRKLTNRELSILQQHFVPHRYGVESDIVYEGQVPNTGIVLLKGKVFLYRRRKLRATLGPGTMLGVAELWGHDPLENNCRVSANSELILIKKSDLTEALRQQDSALYEILKAEIS